MPIATLLSAIALCAAEPPKVTIHASFDWTANQIDTLREWVNAAPSDALPLLSTKEMDRAQAEGDSYRTNKLATELALTLGKLHLEGCTKSKEQARWHINTEDESYDLEGLLGAALAEDEVSLFFAILLPRYPDYLALRMARETETDPAKRAILALNMERWRWMPLAPGEQFVIVNPAEYQLIYWREGKVIGRWPVIVGKPDTPTPVFSANASGVTLNPWWDVPQSIVDESIGALVRRNPAAARKQGYGWSNGAYRQRPGPNNALGQMKLVMPNSFHVYLHDTPNRKLFEKPDRALSHGCIRVADAIGFAATLLGKQKAELEQDVRTGKTVTLSLADPVPVYIGYFTATAAPDRTVRYHPDIYSRDRAAPTKAFSPDTCPG
jgi:L,D-transpeptidase YcbB